MFFGHTFSMSPVTSVPVGVNNPFLKVVTSSFRSFIFLFPSSENMRVKDKQHKKAVTRINCLLLDLKFCYFMQDIVQKNTIPSLISTLEGNS